MQDVTSQNVMEYVPQSAPGSDQIVGFSSEVSADQMPSTGS